VLVQPELPGVELVIGGLRDPQFGPLVMVGLGGTLVEVLGDVEFALAPLTADDAHRALVGLRGQTLLTGVRGSAPADVDALVGMITAVGDLVASVPEITELDLNPVIVTPAGPVAVDWRIRIKSPGQPRD
jgi:acetyltransferase